MSLNPRITEWSGRRVWIVGASSGIGAALAKALLARGARLALSARRREPLDAIAAGSDAVVLPLDVTDAQAMRDAAGRLLGQWNGLDLVVLLAAAYREMRASTWNLEDARRIVDVNIGGVLNGIDAVLPTLRSQRAGAIAIVASVAGYAGLPQALAYGPTKAALINFAETLYLDLHPEGVGVYLVCPGFVETPLTAGNAFEMPALMKPDEAARRIVEGFAAGRFEIHFPRRFTGWLKLLRMLPYRLQFAAVRRVTGL